MVDRSMDSNGLGDDGLALFEQMKASGLQLLLLFWKLVLAVMLLKRDSYVGLLGVVGKSGHLAEAREYILRSCWSVQQDPDPTPPPNKEEFMALYKDDAAANQHQA